ncbi:MAG: MFS transporter, partial [Pseudonocardia sp.]
LLSLLADVSPAQGLGYGLAAEGALGLLFGVPSAGIVLGGVLAGALATRIGPAATLVLGTVLGTLGTTGLFLAASTLPLAVACSFLLSLTAGTLLPTGFTMAATLTRPERQGVVSSLVMVMVAIGSVVLNFVGGAVLTANQVVVDGSTVPSAAGVFGYLGIGTGAFVLAGVTAVALVCLRRRAAAPPHAEIDRAAAPR